MTTDISGPDRAYAMVIQTDGKLVVAGYAAGGISHFAVVRYQPNGSDAFTKLRIVYGQPMATNIENASLPSPTVHLTPRLAALVK